MLTTSIKNGLINGAKSCWFLIKIIIPVYFFITALKYSPVMDWLVSVFAPLMSFFNLPGEAAIPLIAGLFLDEYAVIAAINAISLTGYSVTVVAVMTQVCHSLFIEGAITKKLGVSVTFFTLYRLTAAVIVGYIFSIVGVVFNLW